MSHDQTPFFKQFANSLFMFVVVMLFVSAITLGISTGMVQYSISLYAECCPDQQLRKYSQLLRPIMFATGGFFACILLDYFIRYGIILLFLQVGQMAVSYFFRELNYNDRLEVSRLMERSKNVPGLAEKIQNESLIPRSRW